MTIYHPRRIYGVDVKSSDEQFVQIVLRQLFKALKKAGFEISINHWGEIILAEPHNKLKALMSIGYLLDDDAMNSTLKQLKKQSYLAMSSYFELTPKLRCQFRFARRNTRHHTFDLPHEESDVSEFVQHITHQLNEKSRFLNPSTKYAWHDPSSDITVQDILALIRYGAVTFKASSCLHSITKEKIASSPKKIIFDNGSIELQDSYGTSSFQNFSETFGLTRHDIALFEQFLPAIRDGRVEISQ